MLWHTPTLELPIEQCFALLSFSHSLHSRRDYREKEGRREGERAPFLKEGACSETLDLLPRKGEVCGSFAALRGRLEAIWPFAAMQARVAGSASIPRLALKGVALWTDWFLDQLQGRFGLGSWDQVVSNAACMT